MAVPTSRHRRQTMEGLRNCASGVQPGFELGLLLMTKTIFHSPQPQALQPCKPITSVRCPPSKAEAPASAQRHAHSPPQAASCLECCLSEQPVHLQCLLLAESHTWRLNSRPALHSANKHGRPTVRKALSCYVQALCAVLYSWRTSFGTHEGVGTIIMPILQMRKLRQRMDRQPVQGHTTS